MVGFFDSAKRKVVISIECEVTEAVLRSYKGSEDFAENIDSALKHALPTYMRSPSLLLFRIEGAGSPFEEQPDEEQQEPP